MAGTNQAIPASVPASIKGWDQLLSLADMPPDHAVVMDNFIPRPGYLEVRRGSEQFATGIGSSGVNTIMAYNSSDTTNSKLFAIGGTAIYDITAGGAGSSVVSGLSDTHWQYINFSNVGTNYLICANGIDTPQIYSTGAGWGNLSVSGITLSDIVQPYAWKGRLWFVKVDSLVASYLPVGNISGAVADFDLGPFATKGGYLNAIASWTIDTNQTVDEYLAFITSRGQVIVYQGTDPATANTFALVGVYNLGAPIGRRCFLRISGNLWVICVDGIIPMTEMLVQAMDRNAAARVAPTTMIMNAVLSSAQMYAQNFGWQFISYPKGQLAILNIPQIAGSVSVQYVMNTLTGAWCRFLNLDAQCWETLNDNIYFGSTDGRVYQWDIGSGDYTGHEALPITATVQTAFNYFNTRGHLKRWTMIRPVLTTDGSVFPGVGLNIDYGTGAPISIPSSISGGGSQWDVAVWDVSSWSITSNISSFWTTVEGIGQCCSIITQVVTADNGTQNGVILQLNSWDLLMEPAAGFF
jgi:hypothetical protein